MTASTYEYKTVALPQTVQGRRRRGVSEADLVAETLGELIHLEAVDGWEYFRSDILAAGTRGGMFSKEPKVTYYSVLVFRRMQEGVWPAEEVERVEMASPPPPRPATIQPRPPVSTAPASEPTPEAVPAAPTRTVAPHPPVRQPEPVKPVTSDPTSPLAQGGLLTTGGQFRADSRGSAISPRPAPRTAPLPPLGSAQD